MDNSHFSELFPAVFAGLGLFLVGAVNLLLARRGMVARAGATLLAIGAVIAGAGSLDHSGVVPKTCGLLALGLIPCYLLASRRFVGGASSLVKVFRSPIARSAFLLVAGVSLALCSLIRFERAEEAELDTTMADLDWLGHPPRITNSRITATTDKGNRIPLQEPSIVRDGIDWNRAEEKTLKGARLDGQVLRKGGATERSNCHGWVFTGGNFSLPGEVVEIILKENGYREVTEPQPGDLVIYRITGGIAHTAIVRYVTEGQPVMVEGKWGPLGVFLHEADKSTYGTDYTFYRSSRKNHLLVGLGGSPAKSQPPPAVTE